MDGFIVGFGVRYAPLALLKECLIVRTWNNEVPLEMAVTIMQVAY